MESVSEYRNSLKKITNYAFNYATNKIGLDNLIKNLEADAAFYKEYTKVCYEGYKIAQKLLIIEIKKYQGLLRNTNKELKEARREKNKDNIEKGKQELIILEQRHHTLLHIADGIAWHLIGGEIHIARRLCFKEEGFKYLDSCNIEFSIKVADEINKRDDTFALITDITSYIQVGDLLVFNDKDIKAIELKEGKNNTEIIKYLAQNTHIVKSLDNNQPDNLDDKSYKQAQRMLRQLNRNNKIAEIINTDEGIDPKTGANIKVGTPQIDTEYYYNYLIKLHKDLESKIWAYTVVEDCLHIGMYRNEALAMSPFVIKSFLKTITENYIVTDWMTITQNISEPIFMKPFPVDFILDILTGSAKVIIGLDLDRMIDKFNQEGLKTRWLSTKETAQQSHKMKMKIFSASNRGIAMTLPNKKEVILEGGIISKIIYDNVKPSSIAQSLLSAEYTSEF